MDRPKIIDSEAHFYSPSLLKYVCDRKDYPHYVVDPATKNHRMNYASGVSANHSAAFMDNLLDIGEKRIQLIDHCGVDIRVLSLPEPSVGLISDIAKATSLAHDANELLAEAMKKHPTCFNGFAALAPQNPELAVKELQHCIAKLGFFGWLTHSNYGQNNYLDDKKYWPILEAADGLECANISSSTYSRHGTFLQIRIYPRRPPLGFQLKRQCVYSA